MKSTCAQRWRATAARPLAVSATDALLLQCLQQQRLHTQQQRLVLACVCNKSASFTTSLCTYLCNCSINREYTHTHTHRCVAVGCTRSASFAASFAEALPLLANPSSAATGAYKKQQMLAYCKRHLPTGICIPPSSTPVYVCLLLGLLLACLDPRLACLH